LTARSDSNDGRRTPTASHHAQSPAGSGRCRTPGHRFGGEGSNPATPTRSVNDVQDITNPLREFARVTREGSQLIILMLHPCFYGAHTERTSKTVMGASRTGSYQVTPPDRTRRRHRPRRGRPILAKTATSRQSTESHTPSEQCRPHPISLPTGWRDGPLQSTHVEESCDFSTDLTRVVCLLGAGREVRSLYGPHPRRRSLHRSEYLVV
jgi:hypothetical protein